MARAPLTEADRLARDIRRMDRDTLAERVARVVELNQRTPNGGMLLAGGEVVIHAFYDSRRAFLYGLWLPAILAALAGIQQHLSSLLHIRNIEPPETPDALIAAAQQQIGLDAATGKQLTRAFAIGAVYSQWHPPMVEVRRTVETGKTLDDLAEDDAHTVIYIMLDYFAQYSVI